MFKILRVTLNKKKFNITNMYWKIFKNNIQNKNRRHRNMI